MFIVRPDIGTQIKIQRILRGRTQREIAVAADLSFTTLSNIEMGWRKAKPEEISRICAALGIRPEDLNGGAA